SQINMASEAIVNLPVCSDTMTLFIKLLEIGKSDREKECAMYIIRNIVAINNENKFLLAQLGVVPLLILSEKHGGRILEDIVKTLETLSFSLQSFIEVEQLLK